MSNRASSENLAERGGTGYGVADGIGRNALRLETEEQADVTIREGQEEPPVVKGAVVPGVRPDVALVEVDVRGCRADHRCCRTRGRSACGGSGRTSRSGRRAEIYGASPAAGGGEGPAAGHLQRRQDRPRRCTVAGRRLHFRTCEPQRTASGRDHRNDRKARKRAQHRRLYHAAHFIVGITNSAPSLVPEGQRAVTVLVLV